jgi:glycogen debranching enzyme
LNLANVSKEWLWPLGFFARAFLQFHGKNPKTLQFIQRVLFRHKGHILDSVASPFAGLPELTNAQGAWCKGSCTTQGLFYLLITNFDKAWSMATMIELIDDMIL